ncbi:RNA-directed DNA polymerase, eukaryota, partial [Tanacetum coccineum]
MNLLTGSMTPEQFQQYQQEQQQAFFRWQQSQILNRNLDNLQQNSPSFHSESSQTLTQPQQVDSPKKGGRKKKMARRGKNIEDEPQEPVAAGRWLPVEEELLATCYVAVSEIIKSEVNAAYNGPNVLGESGEETIVDYLKRAQSIYRDEHKGVSFSQEDALGHFEIPPEMVLHQEQVDLNRRRPRGLPMLERSVCAVPSICSCIAVIFRLRDSHLDGICVWLVTSHRPRLIIIQRIVLFLDFGPTPFSFFITLGLSFLGFDGLRLVYKILEFFVTLDDSNGYDLFKNSLSNVEEGCSSMLFGYSKGISRWKLNILSVGGRLTLLKSVLGSTPIYNMSIFKVPKSVLNYMESLRRNFFNGFQEGDRKIAWVKWSKVLASKKFRGLGVSSFFALNRALLFKWVWRYLSHDNSLWSQIISALHGLNGHVLSAAFNSTWSSIITEVNSLKVKGVDLISHCKIRVGKGTGTSFWKDLWIGDNLLKLSFPRLFALEENKDISVADKMNTSISSSFRRHVRGGVESQQLDQLSLLLDTVILSNMDDRWFWDLNGEGVFQVKDVRSMLDEAFLPKMEVPTRWIKSIPIKVNVFAWKLYLDRLPTRSNLSRRNVSLPSLACPLCDHVLEDSSHLFFGCSVAKDIQKLICRWWNLDVHPYESYEDWLSWFKSIRLGSKTKEVLEGVFYVSWWSLWNFRNQFLFASPIPRKDAIFDNIVLRSFYWCVARCNRTLNWRFGQGSRPSWLWNNLLHGRDLLLRGVRWQVGNRQSISFWTQKWVPFNEDFFIHSPLGPFPNGGKVLYFIGNGAWNTRMLRKYVSVREAEIISGIPISQTGCPDKLVWHFDSKGTSVSLRFQRFVDICKSSSEASRILSIVATIYNGLKSHYKSGLSSFYITNFTSVDPPHSSQVKINCDTAFKDSKATLAVVTRDSTGSLIYVD